MLVEWLQVPVIAAGIAAVALVSVANSSLTDRVVFRAGR